MSKFLGREVCYRIIQRELPEGVFPDGAPSAFFHTADMDSIADVAATGYANLERIYANFFPQTADELIKEFLEKYFAGFSFDAGTSLQELRNRVIAKARKRPTIAMWEVLKLVAGYVPEGTFVQVYEFGHREPGGFWRLGISKLGFDTVLGFDNRYRDWGIQNDEICSFVSTRGWRLGAARLGVETILSDFSYLQYIQPQIASYGYYIRIFGPAVTGVTFSQMMRAVSEAEPARSVHYVQQNLNLSDFGLVSVVPNADEFSGVNCISVDPSSTTGYTGRKAN